MIKTLWRASSPVWPGFVRGNLGDCKSVGDGVFELRVDYGPGYRMYFAQKGQTLVILLCGGDKRAQEKDIQRAKQYWHDYKLRD